MLTAAGSFSGSKQAMPASVEIDPGQSDVLQRVIAKPVEGAPVAVPFQPCREGLTASEQVIDDILSGIAP